MANKLRFFSTFTGIGGLDWGLEKLGAHCVGFSEIKDSSIRIYKGHYPERKNFGDITAIDPKELPDFDIITGGFPCQSFSMAGLRKGFSDTKDGKGAMVLYLYKILLAKKPKYFAFENVKGILNHDHGATYKKIFRLFESAGYYVRVVLLNAANYGSAQARERVVFLGSLEPFKMKFPEVRDNKKVFRDFREKEGQYKYVSPVAMKRLEKMVDNKKKAFLFIGGYDRVNTLTTGVSSSGRDRIVIQEQDGRFRYLTPVEGERLQGFPDGWTKGESEANRWFAIGNAVNCRVSEYLFTDYLKDVWKL